ncbi:ABC transporter permease [Synechococcus moorigangaii CMS01]|nr:ABC transporter permease [Synechococcus moorigangaii CMS01]
MTHLFTSRRLVPIGVGLLALVLFPLLVPGSGEIVASFFNGAFGGRNFFNLYATLSRYTFLLGMALAVLISFRAGLLNIGGEGQLVLGGLVAALVGVYLPAPPLVVAVVALLAAMTAGACWAVLAGLLERGTGVPLLIGSLLLNYPASFLASYAVSHPFRDVASGATQTFRILREAGLPRFQGTILDYGIFLIGAAALAYVILERFTVFGYRSRLRGYSAGFARASGFPNRQLYYRTLMLSGAAAGMTGFVAVFGSSQRFVDGMLTTPLYAWTGIAAVLLAAVRPGLVPLTAFFFAMLATGSIGMERTAGIPREFGQVIQALIVLTLAGFAGKLTAISGGTR